MGKRKKWVTKALTRDGATGGVELEASKSYILRAGVPVVIILEDDQGNPVPNEPYLLTLPGGEIKGELDEQGRADPPAPEDSPVKLSFPNLDGAGWEPKPLT